MKNQQSKSHSFIQSIRNRYQPILTSLALSTNFAFTTASYGQELPKVPEIGVKQLDVSANDNVDVELFLLYQLQHTLFNWHEPGLQGDALRQWISGTKARTNDMKQASTLNGKVHPSITAAYDDMIKLLNNYEDFVDITGVADLAVHAGTREPQSVALPTIEAGQTVASIGSLFGPVGTGVGAVAGGIGGFARAISTNAAIAKNNASLTQEKNDLIDRMQRSLDEQALAMNKQIQKTLLSLSTSRDWTASDLLPLKQDQEFAASERTHDNFLRVKCFKGKEVNAALVQLYFKAAKHVPDDLHPDADLFDTFRAAILLEGAEVVYRDLRTRPIDKIDPVLAESALELFNAAAKAVGEDIPFDDRITYAGMLSFAKHSNEAVDYYNKLHTARNPWQEEILTWPSERLLSVAVMMNVRHGFVDDTALKFLQDIAETRSWREGSTWVLPNDPHLEPLRTKFGKQVTDMATHPIIGKWKHGIIADVYYNTDGTFFEDSLIDVRCNVEYLTYNKARITGKLGSTVIDHISEFHFEGKNKFKLVATHSDGSVESIPFFYTRQ